MTVPGSTLRDNTEDLRERVIAVIKSVRIHPKLDSAVTAMIMAGAGFHVTDEEAAPLADAIVAALPELNTCTCYDGNPANYEGPHADCAVHGAVRAFNEERAENARLREKLGHLDEARRLDVKWRQAAEAELDRIASGIEAERDKTREAEGATLRDENVINGIINGLGIALKIVRGEPS